MLQRLDLVLQFGEILPQLMRPEPMRYHTEPRDGGADQNTTKKRTKSEQIKRCLNRNPQRPQTDHSVLAVRQSEGQRQKDNNETEKAGEEFHVNC